MKGRFDKSRWGALSPLLDELFELDDPARSERLARLRRDGNPFIDDLAGLIAEHAASEREGFLEGPLPRPASEPTLEGQIIGSYTLDRLLGEGGMGAVWLAHRSDGRYEARVAVKLLNPALLGPGGIERFRREGRALGRLTHPNVARLIDAGVTERGQPYLVLEYVEGETITRWCDTRSLDVAARVRLFLDVLAAVAHAHSKLILHRDLKPSNILVAADGQVKLVDFGIAKLLDDGADAAPLSALTQFAGHAFTPDYAAPEQVQGGEVTSATDVYALGVLLYVLLTGWHPTGADEHTPLDRLRAIIDTDPARPSDAGRVRESAPDRAGVSPQRSRALRGDLDNIVLKALKKSPAERYPSAEAFAEDLRRYLNHEPVSARRDSFTYRATKFVIRNKLPVAAALIILLTLTIAAGVSIRQAIEATRQRDRALSFAARNEAVVDFVTSMLTEVAPADQPVRVADLLERSQSILVNEAGVPEHRAAILGMLSGYYLSSGNPAVADSLLTRSLELTKSTPDALLRAVLLCDNAYAASLLGRLEDAHKQIEEGLRLSRPDPMAAVACLRDRAFISQNSFDAQGALDFANQAQVRLKEAPAPRPDLEAKLLADIAAAHYLAGRTNDAERSYSDAVEKLVSIGRGDSPNVFFIRNNWGAASFAAGDIRRALEQYDGALRIAVERSIGGEPPPYLLLNRAMALSTLARYPEALDAYVVAIDSATRAGNTAIRIGALANRATTFVLMGDVSRAEQEVASIAPEVGKTVTTDSVPAMGIMQLQARIDAERGRLPEAVDRLTKIVAFFDGRKMAVAPVVRALNIRGDLYLRSGNTDAAMVDAQRALEIARGLQGGKSYSSLTGNALVLAARVHESRGDRPAAVKTAGEAVPHLVETLGAEHPDTVRARKYATLR